MALLGLMIVAINTALISVDVLSTRSRLGKLKRRLGSPNNSGDPKIRLWRGRLQGESLPALHVTQVGHSRGEGKIVVQERDRQAKLGGAVQLVLEDDAAKWLDRAAGPLALDAPQEQVWVWPSEISLREAALCPSREAFDELETRAQTARGVEWGLDLTASEESLVYVYGRLTDDGHLVPAPVDENVGTELSALLVAATDPRAWLRVQRFRLLLGVLGIWAALLGSVAVCAQPPAFGPLSQLGALLLFIFFLLVQPFGVFLRESSALPHEARKSVVWKRPRLGTTAPLGAGS
jgi:hypothetical protein